MHAKNSGLFALALSDHDNTNGLDEAEETALSVGIEFVPAVEFSVLSKTETHIVGLYIDRKNPYFIKELEKCQKVRLERNYETEKLLKKLGFECTYEEAAKLAGHGTVSRGHFANIMVMKGYASSFKEAFSTYFVGGKPAYSGRHYFTDEAAIDTIHKAGGVSILAHPHLTRLSDNELFEYISRLKAFGLDGIEGYYTDYTPEMQEKFISWAKKLDLIISGGSDFHGKMKPHISIGKGLGNMEIPYSVLDDIKNYRKNSLGIL